MRDALPATIAFLLGIALTSCTPPQPAGTILVIIDTLRADHLGVYGYERPTSPSLDAWAAGSRVFERALSTSPWTLPAVGSLLTGQLPTTHRAGWMPDERVPGEEWKAFWQRSALGPEMETLATRLQSNGVRTAAFAANPYFRERFGLSRGFDTFEAAKLSGGEVLDKAVTWMEEVEGPFFVVLHLMEPHVPYAPPESTRGVFTDGDPTGSPVADTQWIRDRLGLLSDLQWEFIEGRYDEEILGVDRLVGDLRRRLGELGVLETALLVLLSDHGEELYEHQGFEHGHSMFQEVVRVPLLVWAPGVRPGIEKTPVSLIDLAPTILDAMAVDSTGFSPGRSLWPLLRSDEPLSARPIVIENTLYGSELKSLVAWPMKLTVDWETRDAALYDLEADPVERHDLSHERPDVAQRMMAELERHLDLAGKKASSVSVPTQLSPELERELKSLGYLQD